MPPKGNKKKEPNQRDKRHESGLVEPRKQVTRQRSNGALNGHPNGKPVQSAPLPQLPSMGLNSGIPFPRPPADSTIAEPAVSASASVAREHAAPLQGSERGRTFSDASMEDTDPLDMGDGTLARSCAATPEHHRSACRTNSISSGSTLATAATILAYFPLYDAIAILILLLSLPSTLLLVIQTLFASLTFVPPTAGISLSTLPSIKEMFHASNLGTPALATIVAVDIIMSLIWLTVWKPAQSFLLDLSNAVIAVSLSGAAASTGGPTNSVAICGFIVFAVHLFRYKETHLLALDYLRSTLQKFDISIDVNSAPSYAFMESRPMTNGKTYTVIRAILGIHILSQGAMTVIRRAVSNANEKSSTLPTVVTFTPEGASNSELSRGNTGLSESSQHVPAASSTDGRPPGPSPAHRDGKVRESSSKKRRKQANEVRSKQPLWAAIASTKVTFVKEMEQRDAAADEAEALAMGSSTNVHTTTNSPTDKLWIREIHDTEILFSVQISPSAAQQAEDHVEEGLSVSASIDKTKPFFVRINGADWGSTRIHAVTADANEDGKTGQRFDGEIFGLAALSNYHCEIVALPTQKATASTSLITQPTPSAEQVASAHTPPQHQTLRPSSPITTLKQSIASAEAKLNETRNRFKRNKKDQKAAVAEIKKEINTLKSKVDSSGGADEKQRQRKLQISQHVNQAEEATAALVGEMDALGDIPEDEVENCEIRKRAWQAAKDAKTAANKDFDYLKAETDREITNVQSELQASQQKHERLALRLAQRTKDYEKLVSQQQADFSAKQQHDLQRFEELQSRLRTANNYGAQIAAMDSERGDLYDKAMRAWNDREALQNIMDNSHIHFSSPPTPEGALPGINHSLSPHAQTNGSATVQYPQHPFNSLFNAHAGKAAHAPRGRSSSMLSSYSGFTDNNDDLFEPRFAHSQPMTAQASAGAPAPMGEDHAPRNYSDGTTEGSGSTASSSPRPEAKPFVPSGKAVGTIGPPKAKEKQSPGHAPLSPAARASR